MTPPPAAPPPGSEAPLRLTRRGLVRSVQLAATAGVLGTAAVSCSLVDRSGRPGRTAASAGGATGRGSDPATDLRSTGAPSASPATTGTTTTGTATTGTATTGTATTGTTTAGTTTTPGPTPATRPAAAARTVAAALPGVGGSWTARLAGHDQVVLVTGAAMGTTRNTVRWFDRTAAGWARRAEVSGWNGRGGWAVHHSAGDLRSPVGLYDLTDAGGFSRNPGTDLPYQWSPAEYSEVLNGVRTFDHVLAIDYNRVAGRPPSDSVRPDGWSRGGSIWIHVAHRSPTEACIGIEDPDLVDLLRWLRPAARPAVLMGPASVLSV